MVRPLRLHRYTIRLNTGSLEISLSGGPAASSGFERFVGQRLRQAFEAYARRESPVRTGRLRRSLRAQRTPRTLRIVSRVRYFEYVWRGTRYIRPNRFIERAESRIGRDLDRIVAAGVRMFPRAFAA